MGEIRKFRNFSKKNSDEKTNPKFEFLNEKGRKSTKNGNPVAKRTNKKLTEPIDCLHARFDPVAAKSNEKFDK